MKRYNNCSANEQAQWICLNMQHHVTNNHVTNHVAVYSFSVYAGSSGDKSQKSGL